VLDINLAGRRSYMLAEYLKSRRVPFVFCSGYADPSDAPADLARTPLVAKPVSPAAIIGAIEQALRRS
jgi:CheY-like chemotaxis protein